MFFIIEHKLNITLNERKSNYEQQIKEYETKLDQSTDEIERIRLELSKLQDEKVSCEQTANDTINRLKQDYEILKTELQDRGF